MIPTTMDGQPIGCQVEGCTRTATTGVHTETPSGVEVGRWFVCVPCRDWLVAENVTPAGGPLT